MIPSSVYLLEPKITSIFNINTFLALEGAFHNHAEHCNFVAFISLAVNNGIIDIARMAWRLHNLWQSLGLQYRSKDMVFPTKVSIISRNCTFFGILVNSHSCE